jgi:hypothetical protein
MSDGKMAFILFDVGLILMLASMVLGPFGVINWAVTAAVAACCLALGAMSIAFEGWDSPQDDSYDGNPQEAERSGFNRQ